MRRPKTHLSYLLLYNSLRTGLPPQARDRHWPYQRIFYTHPPRLKPNHQRRLCEANNSIETHRERKVAGFEIVSVSNLLGQMTVEVHSPWQSSSDCALLPHTQLSLRFDSKC